MAPRRTRTLLPRESRDWHARHRASAPGRSRRPARFAAMRTPSRAPRRTARPRGQARPRGKISSSSEPVIASPFIRNFMRASTGFDACGVNGLRPWCTPWRARLRSGASAAQSLRRDEVHEEAHARHVPQVGMGQQPEVDSKLPHGGRESSQTGLRSAMKQGR